MSDISEQKKPESRIVLMKVVDLYANAPSADLLVASNLARRWLADTIKEAQRENGDTTDSIRREIVFAVCFAESYIFEWAREVAGWQEVIRYFKFDRPEKVKDRWKRVPAELYDDGVVETQSRPAIDWGKMGEVTQYRHGLVHGASSIPRGLKGEQGEAPEPVPSLGDLRKRGQGWALKAVLNVVEQLHRETDTALPEYLRNHVELA